MRTVWGVLGDIARKSSAVFDLGKRHDAPCSPDVADLSASQQNAKSTPALRSCLFRMAVVMATMTSYTTMAIAAGDNVEITCPENQAFSAWRTICQDGNSCGAITNEVDPAPTSNSGQDNVSFVPPSGQSFPINVTWQVVQKKITVTNPNNNQQTTSADFVPLSIDNVSQGSINGTETLGPFFVATTPPPVKIQISAGNNGSEGGPKADFSLLQYRIKCEPTMATTGTLIIKKEAYGGSGSFGVTATSSNDVINYALDTTGNNPATAEVSKTVPTGTYAITETGFPLGTDKDDWDTEIQCTEPGKTSFNRSRAVIENGKTTKCKVTNERKTGEIIIEKKSDTDTNDGTTFPIRLNGTLVKATNNSSGLEIGEMTGKVEVPTGTATVTEDSVPGWALDGGIVCKEKKSGGYTGADLGSTFEVEADEEYKCWVKNKKVRTGTLEIYKVNNGGPSSDTFQVTYTPTQGSASSTPVSQDTPAIITGIAIDEYTISETGFPGQTAAGDYVIDISCVGNNSSGAIAKVVADGPYVTPTRCTVTNTRKAGFTVEKLSTGGVGTFDFTRDFGGPFSITTAAPNVGVSNANSTFTGLTPGQTYTVTEAVPAGWTLQSIDGQGCTQVGNSVQVTPQAGDNITCRFINFKKTDDPMDEVTQLFVHRRVDNLLTYGPDRARLLRRLQDGDPPVSLKDAGPIKLNGNNQATLATQGFMGLGASQQITTQTTIRNGEVYQSNDYAVGQGDRGADYYGVTETAPVSNSLFSQIAGQLTTIAGGTSNFKFSTSLSELREAATEAEQRRQEKVIKDAGLGFASEGFSNRMQSMRQGWDVWAEGHISKYNDGLGGYDRDGDFRILYVGADYPLAPGVLIGALVQVDDTREDVANVGLTGEVEGTGWMAGPYIGIKLADNLFFDARAAYGTSDNDIWLDDAAAGFRTGSFETDRWLASATLTGNQYFGNFRISPQFGLAYGNEWYDDYFNSIGQLVPGRDISIGRLNATLEAGYRFDLPDGTMIEPHVSISGLVNFSGDDLIIGGQVVDTNDSRAKVEGGVLVRTPSGYAIRAAGSYDGIGEKDLEAYSGSLWINVPLN